MLFELFCSTAILGWEFIYLFLPELQFWKPILVPWSNLLLIACDRRDVLRWRSVSWSPRAWYSVYFIFTRGQSISEIANLVSCLAPILPVNQCINELHLWTTGHWKYWICSSVSWSFQFVLWQSKCQQWIGFYCDIYNVRNKVHFKCQLNFLFCTNDSYSLFFRYFVMLRGNKCVLRTLPFCINEIQKWG